MNKIVFVILHYENLVDTKECINSLCSIIRTGDEVVVVDNGSQKGKISQIKDDYKMKSYIHFIESSENLGFARGNNLGFYYAKHSLKAKIIVLANNDLLFKQSNFCNELDAFYEKEKFDVAGPKIISLVDNLNQNPVKVLYSSIDDIKKRIFKFKILFFMSIFNCDVILKNKFSTPNTEYSIKNNEDFQLHGACLIFGNKYLNEFDGLCDKTFMYGEESILKYIVQKKEYSMKYIDTIEVIHKEGASTHNFFGRGKRYRQFFYKNNIKSCNILIQMIKEENKI